MTGQLLVLLFLGLVCLTSPRVLAQDTAEGPTAIVPGAYIIEYEDDQNDEPALFKQLNDNGLPATKRMSLNYKLFKGTSVQLNKDSAAGSDTRLKILSLPRVKSVWPVQVVELPRLKPSSIFYDNSTQGPHDKRQAPIQKMSTHVMTQVDKLHEEGLSGKGIRIAVIDTGLDYTHPALGGCFGSGCLVSHGTDLIGDNWTRTNIVEPDADPRDCYGHGTHVAGIVASQPNPLGVLGAAPGATLGAYRVLDCWGRAPSDVILAGFVKAYEDGNDIITASLGLRVAWAEDAFAVVISRIVDAGVPVVVSNGNSGELGMFSVSSPAVARGATAVASVDNSERLAWWSKGWTSARSGNSSDREPFLWLPNLLTPFRSNLTLPMYMISQAQTISGTWDACAGLKAGPTNLTGHVVVAGYSTNCDPASLDEPLMKIYGAHWVLYYPVDPESGLPVQDLLTTINPTQPRVKGSGLVSNEQAQKWQSRLSQGKEIVVDIVRLNSSEQVLLTAPNPPGGGLPSFFTSFGPSLELDLKPQVAAPGGYIMSTVPASSGSYGVESGTSMAAPLLAGVYALMMEALGTKDPVALRNRVGSTASQMNFYQRKTELDGLAPVPQQGGGLVQAFDAVRIRTTVDKTGFSFNDTAHHVSEVNFTITNSDTREVAYQIGHTPALTVHTFGPSNKTNPVSIHDMEVANGGTASLAFSSSAVTIPAGASALISVQCTPPNGLDGTRLPVYSGYITISASGSSQPSLSIPYLGVVGSMHSASANIDQSLVFVREYAELPSSVPRPAPGNLTWVIPYPTSAVAPPIDLQKNGTLQRLPAVSVALQLGSPSVRVDIVPIGQSNVSTTEVLGARIAGSVAGSPFKYVGKAPQMGPFTGMTQEGDVLSAGKYAFLVRVLRIFGDATKADDYVSVQTKTFEISYR